MCILGALMCLSACWEEPENVRPELVVEGWIEDGGAPVVYVTTTLPLTQEDISSSTVGDHVVKFAKVTVSDGEEEVVLTGIASSLFYPPYAYSTGRMTGKAGRTYTLTVDYGDVHAEASATIPQSRQLDSLVLEPYAGIEGESLIRAYFQSSPDEFYRFFARVEKADSVYLPVPLTFMDGSTLAGSTSVLLQPGSGIFRPESRYTFRPGETVHIKFCTMESSMFLYWKAFEEQYSLADLPLFVIDRNLPGNMSGALGYFAGYGKSYYKVVIP